MRLKSDPAISILKFDNLLKILSKMLLVKFGLFYHSNTLCWNYRTTQKHGWVQVHCQRKSVKIKNLLFFPRTFHFFFFFFPILSSSHIIKGIDVHFTKHQNRLVTAVKTICLVMPLWDPKLGSYLSICIYLLVREIIQQIQLKNF